MLIYLKKPLYVWIRIHIVFVKYENVHQFVLGSLSYNENNALNYIYANWYVYLELQLLHLNTENFSTRAKYSQWALEDIKYCRI